MIQDFCSFDQQVVAPASRPGLLIGPDDAKALTGESTPQAESIRESHLLPSLHLNAESRWTSQSMAEQSKSIKAGKADLLLETGTSSDTINGDILLHGLVPHRTSDSLEVPVPSVPKGNGVSHDETSIGTHKNDLSGADLSGTDTAWLSHQEEDSLPKPEIKPNKQQSAEDLFAGLNFG